MDILNLIRISVKALLRNKTRTALSMLGIVIGIAAVIAVVNLGEGLKQSTANQLSDMGTNLIMVDGQSATYEAKHMTQRQNACITVMAKLAARGINTIQGTTH